MKIFPYKRFNQLIQNETFEPMFSWGIRMAISTCIPVIIGLYMGKMDAATWITLTAEAICWVELKGPFGQRLRVLIGGATLAIFFAALGSITGTSIWLSIIAMLIVAFISSLFKNLGDRGSGLSICVYLLFILCNAYPAATYAGLKERVWLVVIGAVWTILVGILASIFMPAQQPYRRSVALIWRSISHLVETVIKGWEGTGMRSNMRSLYEKEKEVRTAINASITFHEDLAHQVNKKNKEEYQLAQLRKATSLVATYIMAASEEMEAIDVKVLDNALRLKIAGLFKALLQTADRMSVFIVTLKPEEELLLSSRISRLNKLILLINEQPLPQGNEQAKSIARIVQLTERSIKVIESCMARLGEMGEDLPVFRSYSLMKTLFTLHPKYLLQNLRLLFNFDTFTTRYALRAALATTIAMFIDKWFHIDHGYWLPFSVLIVLQPYFGATFKKAIDRIAGTLLGGLAGGLLLRLHTGLHIKEIMLCLSFVFMVYYLRRNYAIAAFIITLNLVLIFNIEGPISNMLIVTRGLATIGGAGLAVIAGFALLPNWDKKWLPLHLANAFDGNYKYFLATFLVSKVDSNWSKHKRNAESNNSNVFDSFNRYTQEPGVGKKRYITYYQLITHNVRITRELNNINLELDNRSGDPGTATPEQQARINACLHLFNNNIVQLHSIDEHIEIKITTGIDQSVTPFKLNELQMLYLDKLFIELKTMHHDIEDLVTKVDS